ADAEVVEPALPLLQLAPVGHAEADMVQTGPQLAERLGALGIRMRVDTEQRSAVQHPHHVVEQAGVLVEHGLGIEEPLVPGGAAPQISDGHRHMCDTRKRSHGYPFRRSRSLPITFPPALLTRPGSRATLRSRQPRSGHSSGTARRLSRRWKGGRVVALL